MNFRIARAAKHFWEEPVLSGTNGSGTIFFCGCTLKCVYCQNFAISRGGKGVSVTKEQLADLMLWLQDEGAHNVNLVTPSHWAAHLPAVLECAKKQGLTIPVVYNSGGYDKIADLKRLEGLVDIYLPDFKYADSALAAAYSDCADYPKVAHSTISEMRHQQPNDVFKKGLMQQGVIVRHLVLPEQTENSLAVLDEIAEIDRSLYVSIMAQYFPTRKILERAAEFPNLIKRVSEAEYQTVCEHFFEAGLANGFTQSVESAIEDYVPDFNAEVLKDILKRLTGRGSG